MRFPLARTAAAAALGAALLLAAGAGACLATLLATPHGADPLAELTAHPWWFTYSDPARSAGSEALWGIGAAAAWAILAGAAGSGARARAERAGSRVALFFAVAFFAFALEALRGPAAVFYARWHWISGCIVLTRAVYGGRFLAELALLAAGLHALQMRYRRDIVLLGVLLLVALAIAMYIPIDRTSFLASLTYKLGDEQGVWFANLALGILAVGSLAGAAAIRGDRGNYVLAAAAAVLIVGRQLMSFSGSPLRLAAGFVLAAAGMGVSLLVLARARGDDVAEGSPSTGRGAG
jgi:hypothetical protein